MHHSAGWKTPPIWLIGGLSFLGVFAPIALFASLSLLIALLIAALVGLLTALGVSYRRRTRTLQAALQNNQVDLTRSHTQLNNLARLNHELLDAQDETQWLNTVLIVMADLVGAAAATFTPLDEWGQPLPAIVQTRSMAQSAEHWADHLASAEVRLRCRNCTVLQAFAGTPCPLLEGPFAQNINVYCLPLRRSERVLGMINLYLPAGQTIAEKDHIFLNGLLSEITLAIENIRLRSQEIAALRQLQLQRSARTELQTLLSGLLDGVRQTLEADSVLLQTSSTPANLLPQLNLHSGSAAAAAQPEVEALCQKISAGGAWSAESQPHCRVQPLPLPNGKSLGALLILSEHAAEFTPRQLTFLQSVALQAALLIENERIMQSLEYQTILQERARLAREIHDGLAQTMAYLKLQSAQMQSALRQGDLPRLEQMMKNNYQTLSEAYLDTRQAIDNLRITPQKGLATWLENLSTDFETAAGMQIKRSFAPLSHEIMPEIEAQLIRIVQEALSNIRKHAQAQRAWVTLREWEGDLILEIGDDGRGFFPEDVPLVSQYGLRGMRERAELIGADFQIISQPHQGTLVRLRLPLHLQEYSA